MARHKHTLNDTESRIDNLYQNVSYYQSSQKFKDLLKFCAHFKKLSPYNAMLAHIQKPSARFVLTSKEWKEKYNRGILHDERPLLILIPFGPVEYVFDISQTSALNNGSRLFTDDDILNDLAQPYRTRGTIDNKTLQTLINGLAYHGIAHNFNFQAAPSYGAKIEVNQTASINVLLHKANEIRLQSKNNYLLSVNKNAKDGKKFASICHELGHLFCRHLSSPSNKWWSIRKLSHDEEEFEAETISWLICERLNIGNPSEKYLSYYLKDHEKIPSVSIENILLSVNKIETMLYKMSYKDGLLFKYDEEFKKKATEALQKQKTKNKININNTLFD